MDRAHDALRRLRAIAGVPLRPPVPDPFTLGAPAVDGLLADGLGRGAVHEVFAAGTGDMPAAAGFSAGLAARAGEAQRPFLWIRRVHPQAGALYGHGLAGLGLDPARVIHLCVEDDKDALRAALEGLRCPGLAAVVLEIAGAARPLDLTATRRLKLAAETHGVTCFILRGSADPVPGAAQTRWSVAAAPSISPGLGLPGNPAFAVTLLKHRSGGAGRNWHLEWDHETRSFNQKTLSRPLAALPFDREDREAGQSRWPRAG